MQICSNTWEVLKSVIERLQACKDCGSIPQVVKKVKVIKRGKASGAVMIGGTAVLVKGDEALSG